MRINSSYTLSDSALLAAIVHSSTDAIITKDLNGIITSWNKAAERLYGYTRDEAIGQPVTMLMPEDRLNEEPGILARIRRGESVDHYETIRVTKDGRLVDISLTVSPVHNQEGTVIGASKIARDITEKKRNEAELRRYASIVDSSSDAIISKDLNGIIQSWNRGAETIFGYTAKEAIGNSVTMLMPPDRVNEEPGILARIRRGEPVSHYETVRQRKDGTLIDISLNISPVRDSHGVIVGASKIARDITEHNRLRATEREAELMARLVQTQESERRRIARDIHDHIGQYMTAMRLTVEKLVGSTAKDGPAYDDLRKIKDIAHRLDRDISFLAWELRPTDLEQHGLQFALEHFVNQWSERSGIAADFEYVGDANQPRLSATIETNLYRIAQEALNNIVKHAKASHVGILMHRYRNLVLLIIEDNGKGFDPSLPPPPAEGHGNGLAGIRERVELLNGKLLLESSPKKGTSIAVTVPVSMSIPA